MGSLFSLSLSYYPNGIASAGKQPSLAAPARCLPSLAACPCPSWPASAAALCQSPRAGSVKWAHSPETKTELESNSPCIPPSNTPFPGCHKWGEGNDNTLERTWQKESVPSVMENTTEPRVYSLERHTVFQGQKHLCQGHMQEN